MKTIRLLSGLALAATLLSFSAPLGGEHFEISVNGTRLIQYFVYQKKPVEWLALDKTVTAGNVGVLYNHCGHVSKGRKLAIVDAKNTMLKEWKFENATGLTQGTMKVDLHEISALLSKATSQLSLFYSSEDLPEGRILAHLKVAVDEVAKTE
jgi:hypothetical protein